ncbi:4-hydroxybenzoate polyprenyltransferase [Cercospora zeina]
MAANSRSALMAAPHRGLAARPPRERPTSPSVSNVQLRFSSFTRQLPSIGCRRRTATLTSRLSSPPSQDHGHRTAKPRAGTVVPRKTGLRLQHTASVPPISPAGSTPDIALQPYKPPITGLLSYFPRSWVPYAELIRLDKPAGTYYLFLPCLFSTLMAAPLTNPVIPPTTVLYTAGLFFTGALIMRGAGCTVNDLWDRNLDPHVTRTRLRPIARGAITVRQAIPYLGVQLFAGLALLLQFPLVCLFYGVPSLFLVATYPLAKRVTNYPQAVLGLTFSWGAMMGFPALGMDLLSDATALTAAACLYGSCVAWTIVYDMIYAYQDIRDDAKAGIKSIALAQEKNAKLFLSAVSAIQVGLLAGAGVAIGAGPVYFLGTVAGTAATSAYMIGRVNLNDVKDAAYWFFQGAWKWTGGIITLGLTGEYLCHYFGFYERAEEERMEAAPPAIMPPRA